MDLRNAVSSIDRTGELSASGSVHEMVVGGGNLTSPEGDRMKEGEEGKEKDKDEGAKAKEEGDGEAGATGTLARKHSLKAVVKKLFLCCSRPPKMEDLEKESEGEKDLEKEQESEETEEKEKKEEKEEEEEEREEKENDEEKEKK